MCRDINTSDLNAAFEESEQEVADRLLAPGFTDPFWIQYLQDMEDENDES